MRALKFRVWDVRNNEFNSDSFLIRQDGVLFREWALGELCSEKNFEYIYSQFTGLLDCDGEEIYEGDIVECRAFGRYLIQFEEGAFRTECLETQALEMFMFNTSLLIDGVNGDGRCPSAKIIGNKFENPELLVVKND